MKERFFTKLILALTCLSMSACSSGGEAGSDSEQSSAKSGYTQEDLQGYWVNEDYTYKVYIGDKKVDYQTINDGSSYGGSEDVGDILNNTITIDDENYKIETDEDDNLTLVSEEKTLKHIDQQSVKELKPGDKETLEFIEFSVDELYYTDQLREQSVIKPVSSDNNIHLFIPFTFTNLMTKEMKIGNFNHRVLFVFDDKYEYEGEIWDGGHGGCAPLEEQSKYMFAEVPIKAFDQAKKLEITFGFDENFTWLIDGEDTDFEKMQYVYKMIFTWEDEEAESEENTASDEEIKKIVTSYSAWSFEGNDTMPPQSFTFNSDGSGTLTVKSDVFPATWDIVNGFVHPSFEADGKVIEVGTLALKGEKDNYYLQLDDLIFMPQ